jgi:hypothetical protein
MPLIISEFFYKVLSFSNQKHKASLTAKVHRSIFNGSDSAVVKYCEVTQIDFGKAL